MSVNSVIIGWDNGLSPVWSQAIIWTDADLLSTEPLPLESKYELLKKDIDLAMSECRQQHRGHFVLALVS